MNPSGTQPPVASGQGPQRSSAYYSGLYDPATFWELRAPETAVWENYQPDEPEILAVAWRNKWKCVLELGCGPGRNMRYFAGAEHYVGVDIAPTYIERAKNKGQANALLVCADITALPLTGGFCDLVFSDSTLQHVQPDRIEAAVAESVRMSCKYVYIIENIGEGAFFDQIHLFSHDYPALFAPYADIRWRADVEVRVQPARKEAILFEVR